MPTKADGEKPKKSKPKSAPDQKHWGSVAESLGLDAPTAEETEPIAEAASTPEPSAPAAAAPETPAASPKEEEGEDLLAQIKRTISSWGSPKPTKSETPKPAEPVTEAQVTTEPEDASDETAERPEKRERKD